MNIKTCVFVISIVISGIGMALIPQRASYAHCDTLNGPVIEDARMALEKGDITPVLKWVKKYKEPEITAAFKTTLKERSKGKDAREKADMSFFEMLVRIHRHGEGADFTGLKQSDSVEPIVAEADKALETGSVDALNNEITEALSREVKDKFERVMENKKHMNESVEAGREYVEAYVEYVHYVENLHKAIANKGSHPEHK